MPEQHIKLLTHMKRFQWKYLWSFWQEIETKLQKRNTPAHPRTRGLSRKVTKNRWAKSTKKCCDLWLISLKTTTCLSWYPLQHIIFIISMTGKQQGGGGGIKGDNTARWSGVSLIPATTRVFKVLSVYSRSSSSSGSVTVAQSNGLIHSSTFL